LAADEFIGDNVAKCPVRDWDTILTSKRLSYGGEVVSKAEVITLAQVLPGLPPVGLAASVPAVDLVAPDLRVLLENPELSLKPRSEWPDKFKKAKMHISPEDWAQLGPILKRSGICRSIRRSDLISHHGHTLVNGLFGVGKGKYVRSPEGKEVEVLRLIINLIPSNDLQIPIEGDVRMLPHFAQWTTFEVGEGEIMIWGSEDISCAFYVFQIPEAWSKYFVLDWPLCPSLWGDPPGEPEYLALAVIPMGWTSAVGICEHIMRRLNSSLSNEVGLPRDKELRKDRPVPTSHDHKVTAFYQQYIDNWDAGTVSSLSQFLDREPATTEVAAWQALILEGYTLWGVPRAPDKSTHGLTWKTLGATGDGLRARAWPGEEKCFDLLSLSAHLLLKEVPALKDIAMCVGRWVFALQFKRQGMVALQQVWQVMTRGGPPMMRGRKIRDELLCCMAILPLLVIDFRLAASPLVTCSDASESGGGVCYSTRLSQLGKARLGTAARGVGPGRVVPVLLVESFSGISGGRRALEILGITPAKHIHFETDEAANRVVMAGYPDAVGLGDVTLATAESIREATKDVLGLEFVIHISGPPCQNVSGLNACGGGVKGKKSKLVFELIRLRKVLRDVFPNARHADLCEMVASLSSEDQGFYNKINGGLPVKICPGGFGWVKRPRLYWPSWSLGGGAGVTVKEEERWTSVKLAGARMPLTRWLPRGYKQKVPNSTFCTFVRSTPKPKPHFMPAGIDSCDGPTLARYKAAQYRFPPYQYKEEYLVVSPSGALTPPTAIMREVLMGFDRDYTLTCWSAHAQKANPVGLEDCRVSLLGNSFHAPTVSWLLSFLFLEWGMLTRVPTVAEIADIGKPCNLTSSDVPATTQDWDEHVTKDGGLALVRYYFSLSSHRGGDIKFLGQHVASKMQMPRSINPLEWEWRTAISTPWKWEGEHINVYELRAYLLALRWRFRKSDNIGTKFLHLVDSTVTMGIAVKGRTSSWRLRGPLAKVNALILAAFAQPMLAHVRTHLNPADRPSRRLAQPCKKARPGRSPSPGYSLDPAVRQGLGE